MIVEGFPPKTVIFPLFSPFSMKEGGSKRVIR